MKKYLAEFIGTAVLVTLACGTAAVTGCNGEANASYVLTALAFGLVIVAMAYSIGNVSGCHINPAVSLAMLISRRMTISEFWGYVVFQILGAISSAGLLRYLFGLTGKIDMTGVYDENECEMIYWGLGSNNLGGCDGNIIAGLMIEVILTFIFVLCILGVTDSKFKHGSFGGLVIGFALVLVHILGISFTGTSVNPARSIGPAIFAGGVALTDLWVFIVAPFAGAALAALVYKAVTKVKEENAVSVLEESSEAKEEKTEE